LLGYYFIALPKATQSSAVIRGLYEKSQVPHNHLHSEKWVENG